MSRLWTSLTSEQKLLVVGYIGSLGLLLASYDHWSDLTKPTIVGGVIWQFATMLRGLYTSTAPQKAQLAEAQAAAAESGS